MMRNNRLHSIFAITLILVLGAIPLSLSAQDAPFDLEVGGYVKELAGVSFSNDFGEARFDNILQNRLESTWSFSEHIEGQADVRNRLISGYQVRHNPFYEQALNRDPGYLDMSWTPADGREHIWHVHIDRLSMTYFDGPWEVSFGRQRLNWSRTFVWSPNDLFNNFAYLDFDYEERPGTDAVSVRYSWGYASGLELAYQPQDSFEQSVIAGMLRESVGSYDVQFVGGYYRDQLALGGGFSGYLGDSGLKGEVTYFHPLDNGDQDGSVSATLGMDHMLPSSIYLRGEFLYNGGWSRSNRPLAQLTRPPQANDLFIARTAMFAEASYPAHPLVNVSLAGMTSIDRPITVIMPSVNVSLTENIDGMLLAQLFKGRLLRSSTDTPNYLFARVRWSF